MNVYSIECRQNAAHDSINEGLHV